MPSIEPWTFPSLAYLESPHGYTEEISIIKIYSALLELTKRIESIEKSIEELKSEETNND